jgi:hypothetical protein
MRFKHKHQLEEHYDGSPYQIVANLETLVSLTVEDGKVTGVESLEPGHTIDPKIIECLKASFTPAANSPVIFHPFVPATPTA